MHGSNERFQNIRSSKCIAANHEKDGHHGVTNNQFKEDLAWSESHHSDDWWQPYYQKAFPKIKGIRTVPGPSAAQRAGIDKFVTLNGGKQIAVDEKIRRHRPPNDVLLEFEHVPTNGNPSWPGWIEKDNQFTDFLAYGFFEYRVAFFLPFPTLQTAWFKRRDNWKTAFGIVKSPNPRVEPRYHTLSVPVPTRYLLDAVLDAIRVVV